MKYIAYVRKSTDDKKKQIQSIPNQLDWIKKTAQHLGVDIIQTFLDKKTATKPGREGFNEMMQYINTSKEPLGVLCWKVSRLARNSIDEGVFKYAFRQGKIPHVYASDREYKKGDNIILMGLEFGIATQSSIDLSSSVIFGLDRKIESGYRPTGVPLGYKNDPYGNKGEKKIYKDEIRFNALKQAWQQLLSGAYSVEAIRKGLNKNGFTTHAGNPLSKSTIHNLFNNTFYAGYYTWRGETYQGKHPKMITPAEFEKAQSILHKKGNAKQIKHNHTYNGIIKCGICDYGITTDCKTKKIKSTGELKQYFYLRCTKKNPNISCNQKHVRQNKIEIQISELLSKFHINQMYIDWFFNAARSREKTIQNAFAHKKGVLQKELNDVEAMTDTLIDNLNSGVIDSDQYHKTLARYKTKIATIKKKIMIHNSSSKNWIDEAYKDFCFANKANELFLNGDKNQKREILCRLGSNWILNQRKLLPELHPQYCFLLKLHNHLRQNSPLIEPSLDQSMTEESQCFDSANPIWSCLWDEVRTFYCGGCIDPDT